ncbi:hypothetical protein BCT94_18915, partial [Vibrio breoganii]|uniref:oligosaccharide flippase family protein n=1 Tax=Vibrio breoganii TaxID=553239 RepID=UPI000C85CC52
MSIAKDGYIYVFGEVINKSMPFILIPYLTRNLGEYGYGLLSYYQSIITLFIVLVGISGDGAYAKYYYRYGRRSAYKVVFASAIYSLLISCFFIAYYFFYDNFLYVYIVIIALFQSLININLSKYQCKKEPLSYLKLQCGFTFTAIILTMVLFDLLSASIENRIFAVLIAGLIMVLCVFRIKIPNLNVKQIKTYLLYVIAFGFPLIFHHISFLIKGQLDRIYLINVYPAETISSYAIAYQLSTIVFVLIIALNKAIVPYFYESIKNGTLTSNKLLKYF